MNATNIGYLIHRHHGMYTATAISGIEKNNKKNPFNLFLQTTFKIVKHSYVKLFTIELEDEYNYLYRQDSNKQIRLPVGSYKICW